MRNNHNLRALWLACLVKHHFLFGIFILCGLLVWTICFFPTLQSPLVIQEGGIIESLTALGWFVAAILVLLRRYPKQWALSAILLAMVARELDLHNYFTTDSILKLSYWLSTPISPLEKPLAAMILVILCVCGIVIFRYYGQRGWAAVRRGDVSAIQILCALVLLAGSKLFLDGMHRKLLSFGIHIDEHVYKVAGIWEECLELTAALLVLKVLCFGYARDDGMETA